MFRTLTAFVLVAMATSGGRATGHARDPWPELKKLDYFAGDWSQVGDEKAGPWGPGGRVTMHDHGVWMEGGYFIVIHSTWTGLNSQGTGIEFLGYDPIAKVYTYDEFYSQGEAVHSKGRVDGDTWTWDMNDVKRGSQMVKARQVYKIMSPTMYTFRVEISADSGATWTLEMDGTARKNAP